MQQEWRKPWQLGSISPYLATPLPYLVNSEFGRHLNPLKIHCQMNFNDENLFNQKTPRLTTSSKSSEIMVKSEPQVKKRLPLSNKTNTHNTTSSSLATKVISADTVEFEDFLIYQNDESKKEPLKSQSEPVNHFKSQNRVKTLSLEPVLENKKISEFKVTAQLLSRLLKYDTLIEEELGAECDDPQQLFTFLEQEGKLSHKVLAVFSKSDGICSVSMTQSYGAPVDNLGLRPVPAFPVAKCTRSFYSGFGDVKVLDFTNVPLPDDELRFLIKLGKLQALGLSGTKITCKGIKYLTQHAAFKSTLKCLKLCFSDGLDDSVFSLLPLFSRLQEVDLRGCITLSLNGALQLLPEGHWASFKRIGWPERISTILAERAIFYRDLKLAKSELILDPKDVSIPFLDEPQLRQQLKWHKQVYRDIYLNLNADALRSKLISIIRLRKREQTLYDLSMD